MKILTVVGARPQFIKASPLSREINKKYKEIMIHTGQHYDFTMSSVFFQELNMPAADYCLEVGSGTHGYQTGMMIMKIEEILIKEVPDIVLVYGDTNSTLAGALAACKLNIPLAHIEAGLRSFNKLMPEEKNRILTDHCSNLLFCPTYRAVNQLKNEGIEAGVYWVGDIMYDAVLQNIKIAEKKSSILKQLFLNPKEYLLTTLHRPYNVDDPDTLKNILEILIDTECRIVIPLHPRTRLNIETFGLMPLVNKAKNNIMAVDPLSFWDMLILEKNARIIITDSGGVQKEAYYLSVPCITLRSETEWIETLEAGWNYLLGTNLNMLSNIIVNHKWPSKSPPPLFGDGRAAESILKIIEDSL